MGDPRNDKACGLGQAHVARELTSIGRDRAYARELTSVALENG